MLLSSLIIFDRFKSCVSFGASGPFLEAPASVTASNNLFFIVSIFSMSGFNITSAFCKLDSVFARFPNWCAFFGMRLLGLSKSKVSSPLYVSFGSPVVVTSISFVSTSFFLSLSSFFFISDSVSLTFSTFLEFSLFESNGGSGEESVFCFSTFSLGNFAVSSFVAILLFSLMLSPFFNFLLASSSLVSLVLGSPLVCILSFSGAFIQLSPLLILMVSSDVPAPGAWLQLVESV
mmetsp:Transcript_13885/g.18036  ORF Transcript_13885/g.18036 Transcript_13885/m.18036 type:complete len:233 (+) Transcript_13885:1061-1759(+)